MLQAPLAPAPYAHNVTPKEFGKMQKDKIALALKSNDGIAATAGVDSQTQTM
jgi:hypothetical protein